MRTARLLLLDILDSITEVIDTTPATQTEFDNQKPWRQIIDMRNILIHVYHGINWQRVYQTARTDVPVPPRVRHLSGRSRSQMLRVLPMFEWFPAFRANAADISSQVVSAMDALAAQASSRAVRLDLARKQWQGTGK